MDKQTDLFETRRFDSIAQQKKYALMQIERAAKNLEGQGIPPLFIAASLFECYKKHNTKGLGQFSD